MLRMPEFQVHLPRSAAEAVHLRTTLPDATYVAGGTDLLPNLKHGLLQPRHVVALSDIAELRGITQQGDTLVIGAGTSLHEVATSPLVRTHVAGLAVAAGLVAGPQHRRMGTLGGNVMLDTRCLFYNQSASWRSALGYCLKAEGTWCHVIDSPATCVAAHSADTVPVLLAVDATLDVLGPDGASTLPMRDMFAKQDGRTDRLHVLQGGALVQGIRVPLRPGRRSHYRKVRARGAVDFPQLGVGFAADLDDGVCTGLEIVVTAIMPQPRRLKRLDAALGTRLDDPTIETVAEAAWAQVRAQDAVHGDKDWRRHMVRVEVRRGLRAVRDGVG